MQSSLLNADLLNGYRASKVYHMLIDSNAFIFKALNYVSLLLILWCYEIVFGYVDVDIGDSISFSPAVHTRGHGYKLFKKQSVGIRISFSSERVINAWNGLPIYRRWF